MIQQHKIENGMENIDFYVPQERPSWSLSYFLRGHNKQLISQGKKGNEERANFYTNRIVDHWNGLPMQAIQAKSLNIFKTELDRLRLTAHEELRNLFG